MKRILLAAAIACSLLASCSSEPQEAEYNTYRGRDLSTGLIIPVIVHKSLDVYKVYDTVEVNDSGYVRNERNSLRDSSSHFVILEDIHQPARSADNYQVD